ncbi:uncharacterized protein LOC110924582 [Helianthus annuus]|uniref:uncharacterized protein LOC110924582 n=1 Tax=Helianthus annuus TaxID=4232 RepID=UPI000B901273|nr:uncharacterized protein LOC110924582 [Helianthus annuus]
MLRNCPHHGIQLWEMLNAFHEGLSSEDARDLMSITNGTFGTNYEHVDWAFLEQMAVNSKRKAQSSRRTRHVRQRPQVHGVESHTSEVVVVGVVDEQVEEVNAIQGGGGRNFNMNSNIYHPGLRNHPNFRYGNAANQANPNFQGAQGNFAPRQQYNQGNYRGGNNYGYQGQFQQTGQGGSGQSSSSGNEVMDMLRAMQQDMQKRNQLDEARMQKDEVRDKSIQSLTTQMGQLATDVAELKKNKGQLPSDTKGVVEDVTGNESDDEVSPVKPKESNVNKPGLGKNEKSEKVEGESSQVPFPSALLDPGRKNFIASRGPQKEELWDMFKQATKKKMPKRVDLTGQVSAVLNGELPSKLKDPGTPLINIQVGNFQMAKALLDLGAGVHVCALGVEEEKQDAMALKEGRPPWTHQFESLPMEINSGTRPSLEDPPSWSSKTCQAI